MIEAVFATLIVGLLLVAVLHTSAGALASQNRLARRAQGRLLADALMNEILQQPYADATPGASLGPETGESSGQSRAAFDDVDDYAGYVESTLQQPNGTLLPDTTGWTRRVDVQWVSLTDPSAVSSTETKVKRIIVTVEYNGALMARLTALRTQQ